MKEQFFAKTQKELFHSFNHISSSLSKLLPLPTDFWEATITTKSGAVIENLASIYTINQSIITTLDNVKTDICNGKMNNTRVYYESDLHIVDVLVSIYCQFCTKEKTASFTNVAQLKEKIKNQLRTLHAYIENFPEDLATNIKARPEVISKVSLDYYQLIYLAFTHAQTQIDGINLVKNLSELAEESRKYLN
jgi:hypothetical protein